MEYHAAMHACTLIGKYANQALYRNTAVALCTTAHMTFDSITASVHSMSIKLPHHALGSRLMITVKGGLLQATYFCSAQLWCQSAQH